MPDAARLSLLRQNIDRDSQRLKRVLRAADLRRDFFHGTPDDDDEVVQAFVRQNQDSALKTRPKVGLLLFFPFLSFLFVSCYHDPVDPSNSPATPKDCAGLEIPYSPQHSAP